MPLLAARGTAQSWRKTTLPCLTVMALCLASVNATHFLPQDLAYTGLWLLYLVAGGAGGLYLIPLTSFVQVRPLPQDKGRILGLANCMDFTGIFLAGQLYVGFEAISPTQGHGIMAGCVVFAATIFSADNRSANNAIPYTSPPP